MSSSRRARRRRLRNRRTPRKPSPLIIKENIEESNVVQTMLGLLCFAPLFLAIFESTYLENTIGIMSLVLWSSAIGLGLGGILSFLVLRYFPGFFRGYSVKFLLLFCALVSPILGSFINRSFSDPNYYIQQYLVVSKDIGGSRGGNTHYLFVVPKVNQVGAPEKRLQLRETIWKTIEEQETVDLSLRNGFLGFPIVEQINEHKIHCCRQYG
jgi:hypothetical protein